MQPIVAYDGTNLVWNVSPLTENLIGAILSVLFGIVVMFVIFQGVRLVMRLFDTAARDARQDSEWSAAGYWSDGKKHAKRRGI